MKLFFRYYLNLLAIVAAFVLCNGYGALRPFAMAQDAETQFGLAIGLTAILFITSFVAIKFFPAFRATLFLSGCTAALGTLFSLIVLILKETESSRIGFGDGVLIFLVVTPIFAVLCAAFTASAKNLIMAFFRGDFLTVLFALIIGYSAGMLAVCLIALTAQLSILITILMLIGLAGGAPGVKSDVIDSDDYVVYDSNGNLHFLSYKTSGNRAVDTDGNTLRKGSGNSWD